MTTSHPFPAGDMADYFAFLDDMVLREDRPAARPTEDEINDMAARAGDADPAGHGEGTLPPTLTFKGRREWSWTPAAEKGQFVLRIKQWFTVTGRRHEGDTYTVEERHAVGCMGRLFDVNNESDPGVPDTYECLVGGPYEHCTCTAGACGRSASCKHRDALKAVLAAGLVPPLAPPPKPVTVGPARRSRAEAEFA